MARVAASTCAATPGAMACAYVCACPCARTCLTSAAEPAMYLHDTYHHLMNTIQTFVYLIKNKIAT